MTKAEAAAAGSSECPQLLFHPILARGLGRRLSCAVVFEAVLAESNSSRETREPLHDTCTKGPAVVTGMHVLSRACSTTLLTNTSGHHFLQRCARVCVVLL
jgi:hypothetical protein